MHTMEEKKQAFERLLLIMEDLRAQCPWDKKQTMQTLRHLTIEEVYELADAIMDNEIQEVKKELGDILLHMVFYAKIASESNHFDIADVLNSICEKLIHRHPHIYADVKVQDATEVSQNWEKLKLKEGNKSVLGGVPSSLPALIKAMRIQEKARAVGFDWENEKQVFEKVEEELGEFKTELANGNSEKAEDEFGDLLFALVNFARFKNINPEEALERTNKKFIRRFQFMEERLKEKELSFDQLSLTEMDVYWNEAKQKGL
ncbi:MAG: nucleoside triphosphate pyrophosphohydrolase [Bacteroidota bacterium]